MSFVNTICEKQKLQYHLILKVISFFNGEGELKKVDGEYYKGHFTKGNYDGQGEIKFVNGEKYVAPLYDYLHSKNGEIYISDINPDRVHVLGTPEELQAFLDEE